MQVICDKLRMEPGNLRKRLQKVVANVCEVTLLDQFFGGSRVPVATHPFGGRTVYGKYIFMVMFPHIIRSYGVSAMGLRIV